jgi:ferredoxin
MPDVEPVVIAPEGLGALVGALRTRGYLVLGPTVRNGAIVYEELESDGDLPVGWTDTQDGGTYRLERREDDARFGYAVGPHSWKEFLFPPRVRLWQARRAGDGTLDVEEEPHDGPPLAFFGVRSCELHAIAIQDRVFVGGHVVDRDYASRRYGAFVVAVNCFEPGGTCFCVSMGTGPRAESGYDLALTEILEGEHRLLVEIGSERGEELAGELPGRAAEQPDLDAAGRAVEAARGKMGRTMDASDLRDLLARNLEHPRWDDVAERCLTCGNCTLVCPTCFCSSVSDVTDLEGGHAERWREWDTCFSVDHSYIHGGAIRPSGRSRYRQWMTHKLGTWHDQFGSSGCVGCGRCITWCPVAIDITEEVAAIRSTEEGSEDARA